MEEDMWTMEEFLDKMDSEGGLYEMFAWGGTARVIAIAPLEIADYIIEAAVHWEEFENARELVLWYAR